jgi:hypothetical protein
MTFLMTIHIAAGLLSLVAGAGAVGAAKGGRLHARAGTVFFGSMLVLGATAAMLEPFRDPPGSPIAGLFVLYFVTTSWVTARRRDGRTGWFEMVACAVALATAALTAWSAVSGASPTPVGSGPVYAIAALCLAAGLLDLNAVLRRRLSARQRVARHLWRMCVAFFIATGSFFLGQQDTLPMAVRGSSLLLALAFAPFVVMAFWLARVRFGRALVGVARPAEAAAEAR